MNEVLKAIANRSSTRAYTGQKLTEEELNSLVIAGLQAPTSCNEQEIHITVLDGNNPILAEIEEEKNKSMGLYNPQNNFYCGAPTVMILSGNEEFYWSKVDAGIAAENIAIAAESMGLGSLYIGCIKDALSGTKKAYFANALKFPEGYEFEVAIALGHKAVSKEQNEFDLDARVTYL